MLYFLFDLMGGNYNMMVFYLCNGKYARMKKDVDVKVKERKYFI